MARYGIKSYVSFAYIFVFFLFGMIIPFILVTPYKSQLYSKYEYTPVSVGKNSSLVLGEFTITKVGMGMCVDISVEYQKKSATVSPKVVLFKDGQILLTIEDTSTSWDYIDQRDIVFNTTGIYRVEYQNLDLVQGTMVDEYFVRVRLDDALLNGIGFGISAIIFIPLWILTIKYINRRQKENLAA